MSDGSLNRAEAVAATAACTLTALITVSYLWGRLARLSPFALLGFTIATAIVLAIALARRSTPDREGVIAVVVVFSLALIGLLRLAWPALLPTGTGADLTHHLQLVDYIERHWQLPAASDEPALGEMTHYTPGLHLVAAFAGAWARTTGLDAIYVVVVFAVAVKVAIVFLVARRLLTDNSARLPLALLAAVLALMPQAYALDSFLRDSFLAQVFAELFAVAMWWTLVIWDTRPSSIAMMLFAAAGAATFLTWPMWIGPPVVALVAAVVVRGDLPWRKRFRHVAIALGPMLVIGAVHFARSSDWLRIAATSGGVVQPSIDAFGTPFVVFAGVGVLASLRQRAARTTLLLVLATLVQSAALFAVARSAGATTPYMAYKMFYLLVYPLAALCACGMGVVIALALKRAPHAGGVAAAGAWLLLLVTAAATREQFQELRLRPAAVSHDLAVAGRWARANMEAACFEYLVPNADMAYWLHLAVLGNPRMTERTADDNTFDPSRNVLRWMQPGGLPYAIVHLPTASKDVFRDADRIEEFGTAAILRRTGPAACPDAQRFAVAATR
jgi:hypothetical protein